MSPLELSSNEPRPKLPAGDLRKPQRPVVVQDSQSYLPLSKVLNDGDILLLLTPGVPPQISPANSAPTSDPFEPLGKALAKHHPWVRHVPYLPRNGISGTHVVHIRLATTVIFVISGPPRHGQRSQVALAEIARAVSEHRPQIIVACCNLEDLGPLESSFPAIIHIPNYSPAELEAAANVLFGGGQIPLVAAAVAAAAAAAAAPVVQPVVFAPKSWAVQVWDAHRDVPAVHELWQQCFPESFQLGRFPFQSLLRRDGYAMHYIVREPGTSEVLGFCATYTTYADSGGERLIASMAAILVRPSHRLRGVGLSLHNHALRQLAKTRGVCRLQLGSTFPRLFYGLPAEVPVGWFQRRDWPISDVQSSVPGSGQEVCDWFLRLEDWPATGYMPPGLVFRPCEFSEFDAVLEIVEKESRKKTNVGWYDQYAKLAGTMNIRDIVIGLEGGAIVATALTYAKNTGSPVAEDLPWASTISDDTGGVTCVCITDEKPNMASRRDAIMIRLLDRCIRVLSEQGMKKMFIDAIKGGDEGFQSMGFQKWARYREVWRDV
ncbi:hypothetical protein B0T26DRAFT_639157 [Lasiosphaeria miniovina]|uniref:N-acetyltransferase domain-containing protein n=1 Tax=Lasiosphaeria miniovina TaxID=1954250 RepID=A0AA40E9D7_9PEZI|nr:uncharacterized protein B0T26DRAFT_639157 [Lasiosphaeria miniovina]KAK0727203.1 hypothetical protein B0T26DRAFT_639157 [Lasiosphaeria miniovina]